jgi:hypothetical protein
MGETTKVTKRKDLFLDKDEIEVGVKSTIGGSRGGAEFTTGVTLTTIQFEVPTRRLV